MTIGRVSLLLLFGLLLSSARAIDYAWPGRGTVSFDAPKGWTLTAKQNGETDYYFVARPASGAAALLQITLFETKPDHPVRMEQLQDQLGVIVQPALPHSVEKKYLPEELHPKQGKGWMAQFTDAALVGKPPVPGDYKMMRNALLGLDHHALAIVTMQFDDPKGSEPAAMLSLASSLRFVRGTKPGQLTQTTTAANLEFTVPESKLRLTIPANGLVQDTQRLGGSTDNPRYFKLSRETPDLILSGWFEPAQRFKGMKKFWASELGALPKTGQSAPVNVQFLKAGIWEVVAYDIPIPFTGATNCHLRAELTQAGTWIDLHLSTTSDEPAAVARGQLLATLTTIHVAEK